ncbi:MAG: sigma-54-dependent Fis family transcriptional regulator [Bdellovibrionales bacterium]|nr:sigma-54-dependent Fis family transcriptional regulator [Bdellovibrionales bacterium]
MSQDINILIVEDDPDLLDIYSRKLGSSEYDIFKTRTLEDAKKLLSQQEFAVVATDLVLFGSLLNKGGFDILELVKENSPDTLVIIFTGYGSQDYALEATMRGAHDYVTKPLDYEHVKQVIRGAIRIREEKIWNRKTKNLELLTEKFIGSSNIIKNILNRAVEIAQSSEPILITGPSGSGKALITETILLNDSLDEFMLVNCGSYSEKTLERILFGYARGAFPGASEEKQGLLEDAFEKTLVLDRVDELSLTIQERLFSAFSKKTIQRLGGTTTHQINLKVLATSRENLKNHAEQGMFSKELYGYLSHSVIELPPLKERKDGQNDDILLLTGHFLNKFTETHGTKITISDDAKVILQSYDYPDNVRELKVAIQVAVKNSLNGVIEPQHLPRHISTSVNSRRIRTYLESSPNEGNYCPHGHLILNPHETIGNSLVSESFVFISDSPQTPKWFRGTLVEFLAQFGLKSVNDNHMLDEVPCKICYRILSSKLAILDFTVPDPQLYYELGMLNAVGIPCIQLIHNEAAVSGQQFSTNLHSYDDGRSLVKNVEDWLLALIASY